MNWSKCSPAGSAVSLGPRRVAICITKIKAVETPANDKIWWRSYGEDDMHVVYLTESLSISTALGIFPAETSTIAGSSKAAT
jgi:hypothetical protein